jgi:nickel/cobalt exporter
VTLMSALPLGFALGLRHATDADHVAAIGALLRRETSALRAARLAASWGLGHTITFLAIGVAVVGADVHITAGCERIGEGLVALMLIGLGVWTALRARASEPRAGAPWRPVVVGVVHGLGGSAGVALLALTTLPSRAGALRYLGHFCAGTVAGMVSLTVLLSMPLRWSHRRFGGPPRLLVLAAAALSVTLGVTIGARALAAMTSRRLAGSSYHQPTGESMRPTRAAMLAQHPRAT